MKKKSKSKSKSPAVKGPVKSAPAKEKNDNQQEQKKADSDIFFALLLTPEINFSDIAMRFARDPNEKKRLVNLSLRRLERAAKNRGLTVKEYLSSLSAFMLEFQKALNC